MPKAYWIGRVDVGNPDGYKAYVAANAEPFRKYGAKFLVRGGQFENPEGASRSRNVCSTAPSTRQATCRSGPTASMISFSQIFVVCSDLSKTSRPVALITHSFMLRSRLRH